MRHLSGATVCILTVFALQCDRARQRCPLPGVRDAEVLFCDAASERGTHSLDRVFPVEAVVTLRLGYRIELTMMENQRQRDIAAQCIVARPMTGANHAAVLTEGFVTNVVIFILDRPMSPNPRSNCCASARPAPTEVMPQAISALALSGSPSCSRSRVMRNA